jgi:hypothetical protein
MDTLQWDTNPVISLILRKAHRGSLGKLSPCPSACPADMLVTTAENFPHHGKELNKKYK